VRKGGDNSRIAPINQHHVTDAGPPSNSGVLNVVATVSQLVQCGRGVNRRTGSCKKTPPPPRRRKTKTRVKEKEKEEEEDGARRTRGTHAHDGESKRERREAIIRPQKKRKTESASYQLSHHVLFIFRSRVAAQKRAGEREEREEERKR
jgi:hypothetical protein